MKKLSFSLIAVLAVVVALTSAFTTKSSRFATTYKIYGLADNMTSVTVAQAEAGTLIDDPGQTNETITTALSNSAANDQCASDPGFLCAAEVRLVDPSTKSITETKEGEYQILP